MKPRSLVGGLPTTVLFLFAAASTPVADVKVCHQKSRTQNTISTGVVKIKVTTHTVGTPAAPPAIPAGFTLDLYDEDVVLSDGVGVDKTQASPGVVAPGAWTGGKISPAPFAGLGANRREWSYCFTVPNTTIAATDVGSAPDPAIEVTVGGPGGGTVTVHAPFLPSCGNIDVGATGPSLISNVLPGLPVVALSRGYDQISDLGATAGLYFASDQGTQVLPPEIPVTPGQMLVLDPAGNLWIEDAYGGDFDPMTQSMGTITHLNVNTAPPGGFVGTAELYFVMQGSTVIEYAAGGDPMATTPFLDLGPGAPVTAIAVEDVAPRGTWSAGDAVLFATAADPSILALSFGGSPAPLSVYGVTFGPVPAAIPLDHFDAPLPLPPFSVGLIQGLSVASPFGAQPPPPNRDFVDFVDTIDHVFPYGCGLNPESSLVYLGGSAHTGETLTLGLDNPLGTQSPAAIPFLALALQPDLSFPCGTAVPGFGMAGPGAPGELLIRITPPDPLSPILFGSPIGAPGLASPIGIPIPPDPTLDGLDLYLQGVVLDPGAPLGVQFGLTGGAHVIIQD